MKRALALGADVHARDDKALIRAAENGNTEIVALLLDSGADIRAEKCLALRIAAKHGHTDTVKLLLDRGADIHANGDDALQLAAGRGHTDMVKLLLERGVDLHMHDDFALRLAVRRGRSETAVVLNDWANTHPAKSVDAEQATAQPERKNNLDRQIEQAKNRPAEKDDDRDRGASWRGR